MSLLGLSTHQLGLDWLGLELDLSVLVLEKESMLLEPELELAALSLDSELVQLSLLDSMTLESLSVVVLESSLMVLGKDLVSRPVLASILLE